MKEKVYLDSTIPSYYFDERESLRSFCEITRRWWSEMASYYDVYVSDAVIQEVAAGDYPGKQEIIDFTLHIPLLGNQQDVETIAEFYIENYVMPRNLFGDAIHLAYASYYDIHYLLTWNCNHLANANKKKHIRVINGRLGLATPEIVTPLELFTEEN